MLLKPIRNEQEYDMALQEVDRLMELNPPLKSKESDKLEVLVLLIEKYEEENWAISEPDPIEAIKIRMQQMNLKQKDLVPYIGNRSKVSELLNRKISLSLSMIIKLASGLHLPLETLIQPPKRA
ncbi:DNA-binding protein [Sulfurimonas sp.]|jgi:HTH-type transcriptional regulator/antitoxin HigA|uniref:helix-turn-helix domain-containing protein n=1 Tax=Sulfurimonas sp. TaxID=2022749 RepID=UPI002A35EE38|nr:DNA-binding protein [Sulfurimonas sp.]MDY0123756.1 DNA-binding protein [Sulfurimonas sp.]